MASGSSGAPGGRGTKRPAVSVHALANAQVDKVFFLGTNSATPVAGKRNVSSLAVISTSGRAILVDCGEGTQHQIQVSAILRSSRIDAILLTHLHGDHCYGIFGLLNSMATEGRREPVTVAGPAGVRRMVEGVLEHSGGWSSEETFEMQFVEIPNTGTPGGEDLTGGLPAGPRGRGFSAELCARAPPVDLGLLAGLSVKAVPMVHSAPDWGYVLREPDRPGRLDARRAMELGVPAKSPLLRVLKGGEAVTLEDGRVVEPGQVLGSPLLGRTVAVLQDTSDASSAVELCRGAACVIHEATFEESMEKEAVAKGHSTSAMAARFGQTCGAQRLVLTHFSARYTTGLGDGSGGDQAQRLGEEARRLLGDKVPVVVAEDFMVLRGDRNFEPDPQLSMKRSAWGANLCSLCGR